MLLRMNAVDMIRGAGFEVVEAGDADEAIAMLERHDGIRVMFTDIQIPGSMDGLKLARAVRGRWPPVQVVATSGRVRVDVSELPDGGKFVPKPYTPAQIIRILSELTA